MNKKGFIVLATAMVLAMVILPIHAAAQDASRTLIIMTGAQSDGVSPKTAGNLLAKQLIEKQYQVITLDAADTSGASGSDIEDVKKGNVSKAIPIAAQNRADFIFSGRVSIQSSTREILNMSMAEVVATVDYQILQTASGNTLAMDSQKFKSTAPSSADAAHAALGKMADEIASAITEKLPKSVSAADRRKLDDTGRKYARKNAPPVKKALPKPAAKPVAAELASLGPKIIIENPPINRGFKIAEKKKDLKIKGMVIDSVGVEYVKINGNQADLKPGGAFEYGVNLSPGPNHFMVLAANSDGMTATKEFVLDHPKDELPPEIIIIQPHITRGFAIVPQRTEESPVLKGLAKDDSGLLYVRINGRDAQLDANGNFNARLPDFSEGGDIFIEAADKVGNKTQKVLKIASGRRSIETLEQAPAQTFSEMAAAQPVLWGLAIGVSDYQSTSVNLKYADADAISIAEFLKNQEGRLFSEVHVKTLVNREVTRNSIIENISSHLGKASPEDVVFLFMAGHGIKHRQSGSYYFMPTDADFDSVLSKGLRMSDFEEAVNILSKNVNKIIIAMDTCHSGALNVGARNVEGGENLAEALSQASGKFILSASKGGEVSLEKASFKLSAGEKGHGAFTYALLKGMRGEANYDGDTYISLNELFRYVAKQVPRITDGKQHPYFRMEGTDMPFIIVPNN